MDTPTLIDALRTKYDALKADFGDKAADRLREVVENALSQITGADRPRRGRPPKAVGQKAASPAKRRGRRSWTPAQKDEQRKKMQAYWAAKGRKKAHAGQG